MIYWQLWWVYLKIGIFGFGGGYAMLSLIQYEVVDKHQWLSLQEFTDVVAISQMTPGPIGINSATYIGYTVTGNVWGSIIATIAVCLPSFLLVLLISYFFAKFKNNKYVAAAFTGLRPMTVGLIAAAALLLMNNENFIDYKSVLIFLGAFFLTWKYKIHPILMICLSGILGLVLYW
ncbi:chromate transporter [Odoribacter laneus]|jgi:chromate transport protein|uniref:Chromate ion transporter (CHR) family chromate transporter n=2 Tax=Odoribacter laneus TaxID=626933 RepID=H1DI81_9BACT|nr:chromate transporter [Odoribacter laneus]MBS1446749.1 chromate transporter [Odoribacter sp.]EHP46493.1 chromate ion transporter (CHR) family chromate transporter [Odoribacter laneus YIT 12061]CCZ80195.1 chromate ion transporter (CHR) family chromate transporter [Odoribacter laneus CAG:561]GKI21458.1 chromate transporter [Odoribacter laneus]GKI26040.1 chromate transporter [Odoribacter laneus]